MAIAALDEAFRLAQDDNIETGTTAASYQFALRQYSSGLQLLRKTSTRLNLSEILMSRVIVSFIEKWLNSHCNAELSTVASVHMVSSANQQPSKSTSSSESDDVCTKLKFLLMRERGEFSRAHHLEPQANGAASLSRLPGVETFHAMDDAFQRLQSISDFVWNHFGSISITSHLESEQDLLSSIRSSLEHWFAAFRVFTWEVVNQKNMLILWDALLLEARFKVYLITVKTWRVTDEMIFDTCRDDFEDVVEICTKFLELERSSNPHPGRLASKAFYPDPGIVMILHTVGLFCRDPSIRRRAIRLLYCCQRVEGIYSGEALGMITEQVMNVEEAGIEHAYTQHDISAADRVRLLSTDFVISRSKVPHPADVPSDDQNIDISAHIQISLDRPSGTLDTKNTSQIPLRTYSSHSQLPIRRLHWWPAESGFKILERELSPKFRQSNGPHLGQTSFYDQYDFSFLSRWNLTFLRTGSRGHE